MLRLKRHKQFLKDFAKCPISDKHYSKFIVYIAILIKEEQLPAEAQDHLLKGEYIGFREFHISGDVLLIYKISDDVLNLVRIGTHSQLFK